MKHCWQCDGAVSNKLRGDWCDDCWDHTKGLDRKDYKQYILSKQEKRWKKDPVKKKIAHECEFRELTRFTDAEREEQIVLYCPKCPRFIKVYVYKPENGEVVVEWCEMTKEETTNG